MVCVPVVAMQLSPTLCVVHDAVFKSAAGAIGQRRIGAQEGKASLAALSSVPFCISYH